jgi:hypothetical protein
MRKLVLAAALAACAQGLLAQAGKCDEYWRYRHQEFRRPAYSGYYVPAYDDDRYSRHEIRREERRVFRNQLGYGNDFIHSNGYWGEREWY